VMLAVMKLQGLGRNMGNQRVHRIIKLGQFESQWETPLSFLVKIQGSGWARAERLDVIQDAPVAKARRKPSLLKLQNGRRVAKSGISFSILNQTRSH
jgi:hypothetical protein